MTMARVMTPNRAKIAMLSPGLPTFVAAGSEANKEYGILGIGTGRMPGFGSMLTADDINKIVSYERYCLDVTVYTATSPLCETKTTPRTPPTSTTTTTAAGGG